MDGGEKIVAAVVGILAVVAVRAILMAIQGGARAVSTAMTAQAQRPSAQQQREHCRVVTEERAFQLMVEFPELNDGDIALVLRDELITKGTTQRAWMEWATEETVSRCRRRLALAIVRRQREEK